MHTKQITKLSSVYIAYIESCPKPVHKQSQVSYNDLELQLARISLAEFVSKVVIGVPGSFLFSLTL